VPRPKQLNVIDFTPEEQRSADKMNKIGKDNGHTPRMKFFSHVLQENVL
jgi:hypothetical protein